MHLVLTTFGSGLSWIYALQTVKKMWSYPKIALDISAKVNGVCGLGWTCGLSGVYLLLPHFSSWDRLLQHCQNKSDNGWRNEWIITSREIKRNDWGNRKRVTFNEINKVKQVDKVSRQYSRLQLNSQISLFNCGWCLQWTMWFNFGFLFLPSFNVRILRIFPLFCHSGLNPFQ